LSENSYCACGSSKEEHAERGASVLASLIMMKKVADTLPADYKETFEQILVDWRTHTLFPCDPMAIS
jgi:hypothetical protein